MNFKIKKQHEFKNGDKDIFYESEIYTVYIYYDNVNKEIMNIEIITKIPSYPDLSYIDGEFIIDMSPLCKIISESNLNMYEDQFCEILDETKQNILEIKGLINKAFS